MTLKTETAALAPIPPDNQTSSQTTRKPIVVKDEAATDTEQDQIPQPMVETAKISLHTRVSAPSDESQSSDLASTNDEHQTMRKSSQTIIEPLTMAPLANDKQTEPSAAAEDSDEKEKTATKNAEPSAENVNEKIKQTDKTEQDLEKLEKRHQEIERTIESQKYYVPINTVAQKQSIRISLLLLLLTLLLAIILVDLMFDSGIVLIVNQLPHTHFFSIN
jgi:hypothetical protein